MVPELRISARNAAPVRPDRSFVLYWMTAARRPRSSFGLDRAIDVARELHKPLVVLEALRCGYRWASDRIHRFVFEGMADNAAAFSKAGVTYLPYVEPSPGAGRGLLQALASRACLVVTDEFPAFFLPRMVAATAPRLDVRLESVDGNGLLPLSDADRAFPTAYAFRRHLQRRLPAHLRELPEPDPLAGLRLPKAALPQTIKERWPSAERIEALPIDHSVVPVEGTRGGPRAASARLEAFVASGLPSYAERRNLPEKDGTSRLSPYLHFGHLGIHEVLLAVAAREAWSPDSLGKTAHGRKEGWWGVSPSAEAFLDEAVTWRELGYNFCALRPDYDRFDSLPDWARRTLLEHSGDPRPERYDRAVLEGARTHDPLWNAAQTQLVREGRLHNYLRMLWGKKILQWTRDPEEALDVLIELNNKYALDGRNPNSYSGIYWILGRYDRPWAPTRPIFGNVRYMSSENTARKMPVSGYVARYGNATGLF